MGSETPTAIEKLLAWQGGGTERHVTIASELSGEWMARLDWQKPGNNYNLPCLKYAPTLDAAIEEALGAFEEREKGRGT